MSTAAKSPRVEERKGVSVVKVRCEFALQALDAQIGVRDGKIIGFAMQPPGPAGPLKPAPYVDAAKFSEREVTVGAEGWPDGNAGTSQRCSRSAAHRAHARIRTARPRRVDRPECAVSNFFLPGWVRVVEGVGSSPSAG